jgi:ribosomal protein S14
MSTATESQKCEVCGQPAPAGHRICDICWPDRAVEVGRAAICVQCGRPRLAEKLTMLPDGSRICATHLTN